MIYLLDTNIIRKLLFHSPKKGKVFEDIWAKLEAGIEEEKYISVDECFNELSGQFSKDNDATEMPPCSYLPNKKNLFLPPISKKWGFFLFFHKNRLVKKTLFRRFFNALKSTASRLLSVRPYSENDRRETIGKWY